MLIIRNEAPRDYEIVETITRDAFYNLYMPGCTEHYLVGKMRKHEDFIPRLDFVLELDGRVIGYIMYTKSTLTDIRGNVKDILTFGPLCIDREYQRQGFGKLIEIDVTGILQRLYHGNIPMRAGTVVSVSLIFIGMSAEISRRTSNNAFI